MEIINYVKRHEKCWYNRLNNMQYKNIKQITQDDVINNNLLHAESQYHDYTYKI